MISYNSDSTEAERLLLFKATVATQLNYLRKHLHSQLTVIWIVYLVVCLSFCRTEPRGQATMQAFTAVDWANYSTIQRVFIAELPYLPAREGTVYTIMVGWHLWLAVK